MSAEDFTILDAIKQTLRLMAGDEADVRQAAELLRDGGTVAFPTETVYGLGANALDASAVAKIFVAKQRPGWDPLIVHVSTRAMLSRVLGRLAGPVQARADHLIEAFWPGPLTLLLPRAAEIPDAVTANRARVGVRMPAHPVALALIAAADLPLAAPSANRFGHTSPTTAAHVLEDLDGRIDAVLDGGPAAVGLESTVLDVCEWPMLIYRPGAVSAAQIAEVAGEVRVYQPAEAQTHASPESLPSPGVALRHYAPRARLLLANGPDHLRQLCEAARDAGHVGVMLPDAWPAPPATEVFAWGAWDDPAILAQRLFAGLRALDSRGVAVIVCPMPEERDGLNSALRDRLAKAARGR